MVFKLEITRQNILCSIHPIKYALKDEKERELDEEMNIMCSYSIVHDIFKLKHWQHFVVELISIVLATFNSENKYDSQIPIPIPILQSPVPVPVQAKRAQ